MKYLTLLFLFVMILTNSCNDAKVSKKLKEPATITDIKFDKKVINLGDATNDTLLTAKYKFYNTGNSPLIIEYVNPDCICTKYEISKDTVLPNDSAFIKLYLDTHDKYGEVKLYSTVCANTKTKFYKLTMNVNIN